MSDTTVTPEMLLWLATVMNRHELAVISGNWSPHTDPAKFGRLVAWAPMNRLTVLLLEEYVFVGSAKYDCRVPHDNTEPGIMSAAVVAIARAAGWGE